MRALALVAERLGRSDMVQLLTLLFALLVVVTTVAWPAGGSRVNESWFSMAPVRNAALALAAAGFGAAQRPHGGSEATPWRAEARSTLGALVAMALVTLPFEVVTLAASYPAVGFTWSLAVTLLTVPAYFGLGLLLKLVTHWLRADWALPVAVPASIVVLAWADLQLGESLFNPWSAALAPSLYPLVAGLAALVTLLALARPWRARAVAA